MLTCQGVTHFSSSYLYTKRGGAWVSVLRCLMTPGLRKDVQCHVWPYSFPSLQITTADIRPNIKWTVNQVTADGHFNLFGSLCGYVWVNTHVITPKVQRGRASLVNADVKQQCTYHNLSQPRSLFSLVMHVSSESSLGKKAITHPVTSMLATLKVSYVL